MTSDNRQRRPFSLREYADRYCDGLLSAAQTAELERRLRDDPPALDEFVLYMEIHSRIAWNIRAGGAERRLPADSPAIDFPAGAAVDYPAVGAAVCPPCRTAADAAAPALPTIVLSDASHPTPFVGGFAFSYMVATVFMCLLLLGFWAYKLPSDRGSSIAGSDNSRRSTTSGEESIRDHPAPVFVGRIIGIAGVKWSDDPKYLPPIGINVRLGQQYKLKSGLLEITYDSGAKVILEGPCSYEVDSTAGGYLALGKLVARVGAGDEGRGAGEAASGRWPVASMEDEGGRMKDEASLATSHSPLATNPSPLSPLPSPLFSVRTPTAVVTDLGTEFGMEVLAGGRTETVVFDGAVRVVVSDPMALNRVLECHAGQSVIVESVESGESGVRHVAAGEDAADRFVRVMLSPAARDS
ncbi:MAG: FecR domain-containing protein, partial [Pirellulaceae bacterium]|nr:FecR domain-containing protein [Pirellulaceae bacterium]